MIDTKYDIAECMAVFEFMDGKVFRHLIALQKRVEELTLKSQIDYGEINLLKQEKLSLEMTIESLEGELEEVIDETAALNSQIVGLHNDISELNWQISENRG